MTLENKTIYYCWFGRGELSDTAKRSLASWERFVPGYRIVRCDEDMFDVGSHPWTKAAYEAGKYAYVADYVRFWLIYNFGGVYMDLGSELIRDITVLCETCSPFSGIEEFSKTATTGLIVAAPRHNPVVAEVLATYDATEFIDDLDFLREHTVNEFFTKALETHGFIRKDERQKVGDWTLLQSSAFCPVYGIGGYHVKKDTVSIHHYSCSWGSEKDRYCFSVERKLAPFVGRKLALAISLVAREMKYGGVKGLAQAVVRKIK